MTFVSVVIPIYNGETDLPELFECLRSQVYPSQQVEYLLVDNKSCDRSLALLNSFAENSPNLQIHILTENQIQSSYAARNQGIRAAKAEIIAFTDMDCRPQSQWLEQLVQPFSNPEVGIVVGEIQALPSKNLFEKYADQQETLSQKHTLANSFLPYGQTANVAIRRSIFAQVGLFRPYLTTGGDADLCWRIQQQTSYKLHFAEQAIVQHRHRSTLKGLYRQWRRYGESNCYLHELHGVPLMRDYTSKDYVYRLGRWMLKELPLTSLKVITGKADWVQIFTTPIDLHNVRARSQGQRESQLSEQARYIERLEPEN